jgi:hypothetical protein
VITNLSDLWNPTRQLHASVEPLLVAFGIALYTHLHLHIDGILGELYGNA